MLLRARGEGKVEDVWDVEDDSKMFLKGASRARAQRLVSDRCWPGLCLGGVVGQRAKLKVTVSLCSLTATVQATSRNKHRPPAFHVPHWTALGECQVDEHKCGRKNRERCLSWGPWMMHPQNRNTWARNMAVCKRMAACSGGCRVSACNSAQRRPCTDCAPSLVWGQRPPPRASQANVPLCLWSGYGDVVGLEPDSSTRGSALPAGLGGIQAEMAVMSLSPPSLCLPPHWGNENCSAAFKMTKTAIITVHLWGQVNSTHSIEGPLRVSHCSSNRGP